VVLMAGIFVAAVVAFFEFWFHFRHLHKATSLKTSVNNDSIQGVMAETEWRYTPPTRCFWIEIFEELRYASWCMNKQKRPELNRVCSECKIPQRQTYI